MRLYTITLLSGRQYETTDSMQASLFAERFGIENVIGLFSQEQEEQSKIQLECVSEMSDYGAYYRIKRLNAIEI